MFPSVGITEMIVLGVVAVLLFGSRLPEVAKNLGKTYTEFRRGLTNLQSTIRDETSVETSVEYLKHESDESAGTSEFQDSVDHVVDENHGLNDPHDSLDVLESEHPAGHFPVAPEASDSTENPSQGMERK